MLACTQKQARRLCLQESRTEEARWQQSRNKWRRREQSAIMHGDAKMTVCTSPCTGCSEKFPCMHPPRRHRKRATSAAVRRAFAGHPPPAAPRASIVRVRVCVCVCVRVRVRLVLRLTILVSGVCLQCDKPKEQAAGEGRGARLGRSEREIHHTSDKRRRSSNHHGWSRKR